MSETLLFDSMCNPSIEVLRRNWGRNRLRKMKINFIWWLRMAMKEPYQGG
jgi:hypothetical protein